MSKQSPNYNEDLHRAFEVPRSFRPGPRGAPDLPDVQDVLRAIRAEALGSLAPHTF